MGKRPGKIHKRGPNWYLDFPEADGTRTRRVIGTNAKDAARILGLERAKLAQIEQESGLVGGEPTVGFCWSYYIERLKKECKPGTVVSAQTVRKRWLSIDGRKVASLQQPDIDKIVDGMKYAPSTRNTSIKVLRSCLRRCVNDGVIPKIPVRLTERKLILRLPSIVTKREFKALLSATDDYRVRTLLVMAMDGGLRHSECLHTVVNDCDFERGILLVSSKPPWFSVKSYQDRIVPMTARLEQTLKDHIAQMPRRRARLLDQDSLDWLFPGQNPQKPLARVTTTTWIRTLHKIAGIKGDRPGMHRLRRSWATRVLKNNGTGVAMLLGGWQSLATMERYIGTDTDAAREAIASIED